MKQTRNIIIPSDLIREGSDLAIVIYSILQDPCMYMEDDCQMPYEYLYNALYGELKVDEIRKKQIMRALEDIPSITYNDKLIFIPSGCMLELPHFVTITRREFNAIMNSKHKLPTKYSLLHYWCFIVKSFDWNIEKDGKRNFVGHMSLNYFAKQMQTTTTTIQRYNKCLEDLQLLYIVASRYNPETGARMSNNYGRYEDKDLINDFCNGNVDPSGNFKRSVAARYNCWLNNKSSVDIDELKADIIEYNKIVPQNMMIHLT